MTPPGATPDRGALERMRRALEHRGPDSGQAVVAGQVGMVNTRLAIVDPSRGHQPMIDPATGWLLTYNGEIFNHEDLRARLPGMRWRGHGDTETLLAALATWGEEAVSRCDGEFAFAALDPGQRRLLLVRDRFGVKPLYLAWHEGRLWFASEIKALLAAGVPRVARRDLLAHNVARGWAPGKATPIAGVERLLPGEIASLDLERMRIEVRTWYRPSEAVSADLAADLSELSRGQAADRLESRLRASVRRRLMADVPVGTMCSGGVDSSLITALAAAERPGIVIFGASHPDTPALDEAGWASKVARVLGLELQLVEIDADAWRRALVGAVAHAEYPLGIGNVAVGLIAHRAREAGVPVLLTGEGADELFGGYGWKHVEELRGVLSPALRLRRRLHNLRSRDVRGDTRRALRRRLSGRPPESRFEAPTAPSVDDHQRSTSAAALRAYEHDSPPRARLQAALLGGLSSPPLPALLNRMDKNALHHAVETRVPFLERDVVHLALNMPLGKRLGPSPKGVLRDVAARWLPRRVAHRPKQVGMVQGSGAIIEAGARRQFLECGRLREVLEVARAPWCEAISTPSPGHALALWTAEIWCRLMLDGSSEQRVGEELWVR